MITENELYPITDKIFRKFCKDNKFHPYSTEMQEVLCDLIPKIAKAIIDKIKEREMGQETLSPEMENELLKKGNQNEGI